MSYENPQRIVNRSFELIAKQSARNVAMIQNSFAALAKQQRYNKEKQRAIHTANQKATDMFSMKLDSIDTSDFEQSFDDNLRMFFDDRVDKYFETKNAISQGKMDKREGQRVLNNMNMQVKKFKQMVPTILELAKEMTDDDYKPGTQGGISSASATVQSIFTKIGQGGNINLVEDSKSGEFYLVDIFDIDKSGTTDEEDERLIEIMKSGGGFDEKTGKDVQAFTKDIYKGEMVNLDMLIKNPDKAVQRITKVDDFGDKVFEHLIQPASPESKYINYGYEDEEKAGAGGVSVNVENTYRFITSEDIASMKTDMISARAYDSLLDDEDAMQSVWVDLMGNAGTYGVATEDEAYFDKNNNPKMIKGLTVGEQKNEARRWLIDQGIEKNLMKLGLIETEENKDGEIVAKKDNGALIPKMDNDGKGQFIESKNKDQVKLTKHQENLMFTHEKRVMENYDSFLATDLSKQTDGEIVNMLNNLAGKDYYSIKTNNGVLTIRDNRRGFYINGIRDKDKKINEDRLLKEIAVAAGMDTSTADQFIRKNKFKNKLP